MKKDILNKGNQLNKEIDAIIAELDHMKQVKRAVGYVVWANINGVEMLVDQDTSKKLVEEQIMCREKRLVSLQKEFDQL